MTFHRLLGWFVVLLTGTCIGCQPPPDPPAEDALPVKRVIADDRAGARSHNIDQQRMVVELAFAPEAHRVRGTVTHYFQPLRPTIDSLYLDGPGIRYQSVRLNGAPVDHAVDAGGIAIYPDTPRPWQQTDTLTIEYEAHPRHGMYFTGWNDTTGHAPKQIWTQGQGPGHRHWVPLYDAPNDKLITETVVTFDEDFRVLSNGERVRVTDNGDGTRTWHYRISAPHSGYLMMLGIGRYEIQRTTSASGVEIANYYYPDQPERVSPTYRHTAAMIDILERETGIDYPWSRYAQIPVHNFLHGGMENTTATVFSDAYYVDDRAALDQDYITVNAHEIAHQWFGDLITMGRNEGIWLHESFATHYAKVAERALLGEHHYQWNRKQERDQALATLERGPLPIRYTGSGAGLVYYKGSLVLDMLKDVVGKPAFDRVIQAYLTKYAHQNVTSEDFFSMFDEVLGRNLDWFFEQWILRGGVPHYEVAYQPVDTAGTTVTKVTVRQIHETGPLVDHFRMPIAIAVHYTDGSSTQKRVWIDGAQTDVHIATTGEKDIDFVLFDPHHRVLKQLTFPRSFDELAAQLRRAPAMIDRYDALVALRDTDVATKRAALTEAFHAESFPHLRAEIVRQLAEDTTASADLLKDALTAPSAVVRGAALRAIPTVTDPFVDAFERALSDSSYQNIETALQRLASARPAQLPTYLDATADVAGHDYNVRITRLALAAQASGTVSDELVDYAGPAYSFRTRVKALSALEQLDHFDERLAAHVLDAVAHFNRKLRGPASGVLKDWLEDETKRDVVEDHYRTGQWTSHQANRIEQRLDS